MTVKTTRTGKPTKPAHRASKQRTVLQRSVEQELGQYFELLDGQAPHDLHRMVMQQVESVLLTYVMHECGNNQSKAAVWLGISRGTLRGKLADLNRDCEK